MITCFAVLEKHIQGYRCLFHCWCFC